MTRRAQSLRRFFERATTLLIATSATACAGGAGGASEGDPSGSDALCADTSALPQRANGERVLATGALVLPPTVDYVELRFLSVSSAREDRDIEAGHIGTVCASAKDRPTCTAAKSSARAKHGWTYHGGPSQPGDQYSYFVYTRGDTVGVVSTDQELTALLGPIDDGPKAAYALLARQWDVTCAAVARTPAGLELSHTDSSCGPNDTKSTLRVAPSGDVSVVATTEVPSTLKCAVGRRPEGFAQAPEVDGNALGKYFSSLGELEAASIGAFARLARELVAHGAPPDLPVRAESARRDEIRHARVMARLARKYGQRVPPVPPVSRTVRELEAIAIENAVEGCVRETFGALLATWQARAAADTSIRNVMLTIAEDETEHAALAWDLAEWLDERLSPDARARVDVARQRAIEELEAELGASVPRQLTVTAGLPRTEAALALLDVARPIFSQERDRSRAS